MIPQLARWLNVTTKSLSTIKVSFGEIFTNIGYHAGENIGCVFGQYFPREHRVLVSVSDFGVGIPNTIRRRYPDCDDKEAIAYATEEGITSQTTPRNRGAGLYYLVEYTAVTNGGKVHFHAGNGILECSYNGGELVKKASDASGYYPGTLIDLEIRTDTIENIPTDEEEFEWI